jgi:hypothetical protein
MSIYCEYGELLYTLKRFHDIGLYDTITRGVSEVGEHMQKLDILEDFIQQIEANNTHRNRLRLPMDANSMFVVDDAKQREKMAAAFYRSVRREIAEYTERANHLIQTGSQSAAIMERWALKIQSLEVKKREYEATLQRELHDIDGEFQSLGYLEQELLIRARGIRRAAA